MASMTERMQKKSASAYKASRAKREEEIKKQTHPSAIDPTASELTQEKAPDSSSARSVGRPASSTKSSQMTIVMNPDLKQRFKMYCTATQQTAADVLDRLIRNELDAWNESRS